MVLYNHTCWPRPEWFFGRSTTGCCDGSPEESAARTDSENDDSMETKNAIKNPFRIGPRLCDRPTSVRYTLPVSSANKRRCFSMKSPATLRKRHKLVGKSTRSSRDKGYARVQIARQSSATVIYYYYYYYYHIVSTHVKRPYVILSIV